MEIIKLSATNSTNTYLKELSKTIDVVDGVVVVTENQQSGRGQLDGVWQSEIGKSLTFSVFKRFENLQSSHQFKISMLVGVSIITVLSKLNIPQLSLKWPNDIMSYNKKVGGILIENQLVGSQVKSAVIGIGLNCNEMQFDNLPNATSLRRITGNMFNIELILKSIVQELNNLVETKKSSTYEDVRLIYEKLLFRKDKVWNFQIAEGPFFNGIIRGVTETGRLLLEIESGEINDYGLKELKMIL